MTRELNGHSHHGTWTQACTINILSVAMGLNNFGVGPNSGKGIRSVTIGNESQSSFDIAWTLRGEELEIYAVEGSSKVQWTAVTTENSFWNDSLVWFQADFQLHSDIRPQVGGA